jgi:hypothetical protein
VGVYPRKDATMIEHETQEPMDAELSALLDVLADIITMTLPRMGFALVVAEPDANERSDTRLSYISNLDRDTGAQALRVMIEEWELISRKETRQ